MDYIEKINLQTDKVEEIEELEKRNVIKSDPISVDEYEGHTREFLAVGEEYEDGFNQLKQTNGLGISCIVSREVKEIRKEIDEIKTIINGIENGGGIDTDNLATKEDINEINNEVNKINSSLDNLATKEDINEINNEVNEIKNEVNEIKKEVNEINSSLDNITTEMQSILARLNNLENATPPSDNPENVTPPSDNPIDEVSIFLGNRYEPHPQNFLKGYKYILTPQSSCTWNNPTTVTTIDLSQDVPNEKFKYGSDNQLKGYFKVTTMKNEEIINTPTTFVSTSIPRWYGAVIKRNGKDNVVILGDSLSEQSFVTFNLSYVQQLINKYNSKYNFCTQWAKYGDTTDLQMAGITKYVNVHTNANDYGFGIDITLDDTKYVSIFTGTNEINNDVKLSTFETNYSTLVDYIKTNLPHAKILCITPYLCCKKASNINYINKIKEIAVSKGCSVCDLSTFTELDSVSNGQGSYYLEAECIHLNEAGWNLVNPKIMQAYESLDGFTS